MFFWLGVLFSIILLMFICILFVNVASKQHSLMDDVDSAFLCKFFIIFLLLLAIGCFIKGCN